MKPLIKHISLLLFSGLILPVCGLAIKPLGNVIAKQVTVTLQSKEAAQKGFSFYYDIAQKAFPVLKNLN